MSDYDYTPDTEEVRDTYCFGLGGVTLMYDPGGEGPFDRWLGDVQAAAWASGYMAGFGDGGVNAWDPENPYREGN